MSWHCNKYKSMNVMCGWPVIMAFKEDWWLYTLLLILVHNGETTYSSSLQSNHIGSGDGQYNSNHIIQYRIDPGVNSCYENYRRFKQLQKLRGGRKYLSGDTGETQINAELSNELKKYILDIIIHNKLNDMSPNLSLYIQKYPDLQNLIFDIFQQINIPQTKITPQMLTILLKIISDYKNNAPVRDIPLPLIPFILNLQEASTLWHKMLDWMQENRRRLNLMEIFLKIIQVNGFISPIIRNWILQFSNAGEVLKFLESQGKKECFPKFNDKFKCVNTLNNEFGRIECDQSLSTGLINCVTLNNILTEPLNVVPNDINSELLTFIERLNNGQLIDISPTLLQFILQRLDLYSVIQDIFQKYTIPMTEINPSIVTLLLQLIKDTKTNTPIRDIPESLVALVLNLQGAENLGRIILDWLNKNKESNMKNLFLQIIVANKGKIVPEILRNWLVTLPNGHTIIEFLQKPGKIKCHVISDENTKCVKSLPQDEISPMVLNDIKLELYTFIQNLNNKQLVEISPELLQFILKNPDLLSVIKDVFIKNNIPITKINPQTVTLLLQLIKDTKTNTPIRDIPEPLVALVLNLQGAENLGRIILDRLNKNKQSDMMNLFLQIIEANRRKIIPEILRNWLVTLPNGHTIIEFLEKPGKINCHAVSNQNNKCVKILDPLPVVPSSSVSNDIKTELLTFIQNLNNGQLVDISSNLLQFILSYPDIYSLIFDIFQKNNIPTSTTNPQTVTLLLNFIKDNKTNKPIRYIPQSLLELVLKLKGAENLSRIALDSLKEKKLPDMLAMFLHIIKANGGKNIPVILRNWILSLPNGKEIIEYLEIPGEIQCTQGSEGNVKCIKTKASTSDLVPADIEFELNTFIQNLINGQLVEISPNLVQAILYNPNVYSLIPEIFHENNIPTNTVNPQTVTLLLDFITDTKTNKPIRDIPQSLLELVLKLKRAENLSRIALNWLSENKQHDMMGMFLQIIKKNGGKNIPLELRQWLLSLSNGKEIIEYLEKPGEIQCIQQSKGNVKCFKIITSISDLVPVHIYFKLLTFIQNLNNGQLVEISPNLLQFILSYPDIYSLLFDIFQKNNIPTSTINPQTVTLLLDFIKDTKTNKPTRDIPQSLLELVLKLKGAENFSRIALNWLNENKQHDMMRMFLQIIKENGGKNIPLELRNWILSLPNGKEIIEYLEMPREIQCTQGSEGNVKCIKTITSTSDLVPVDIKSELLTFIQNLNNGQLVEISPSLLQLILSNPNIYSLILDIFQKNNIPMTTINPQTVKLLLDFIKDTKTNKPIRDIPQSLLELVFKLKGAENLSQIALDSLKEKKQPDMLAMFLHIIKANGGKNIPIILRNWILSLPNGKEIIEYLEIPGEIQCTQGSEGNVKCIKTITSTSDLVPVDIKSELLTFIQNLNNGQLVEISPKLLQLILSYPDIYSLIFDIFQKNNIPTSTINPQTVKLLLNFMKDNKTNKPIRVIPESLLKLVLKLKGAENLSRIALNWLNKNKQHDMMQIFLQIIKENGGKNIPLELRNWILSLPNGQKIIEYLEIPGEIQCTQESEGKVKCIKTITSTSDLVPVDINFELYTFIQNLINGQLVEISPMLLQFILSYPDIYSLILDIFQKNNIPTATIKPQTVPLLLDFIKDNKTNKPIRDIPQSLLELVLKLKGAENLSRIALNWLRENKQHDMMGMFLQIIKENGGKNIPLELRQRLLSLSNGKEILEYLEKPGEIQCIQESKGNVKCFKIITSTSDLVPVDINSELLTFIQNLSNGFLREISSKLLQFILNNPDLHSLINNIFQKNNIPTSAINPQTVTLLLDFIKDNKTNKPIRDIPESLLELVLKLKGAENLSRIALNWLNKNKQDDMMQMFLQIIKENGGKNIPLDLRQWILSLSNGKEILEYLEKPGEIYCFKDYNCNVCNVNCVKVQINSE